MTIQKEMSLPVRLPDGSSAPALGMGSWRLAEGRHPINQEIEALSVGLSLGVSLIDTAEIYGNGASEKMIGKVISDRRSDVFLVSKVRPTLATSRESIRKACIQSLNRLRTDYLDLYLLHWRGGEGDLQMIVDTFEELKHEGHIRRWGVSNFDVNDMEELFRLDGGKACAVNQVPYSLSNRRIERKLIPWSQAHGVPLMAYSPLGSSNGMLRNSALAEVARKHQVSPATVAIAWTMINGITISIPESGSASHIRENAAAMMLLLDKHDLNVLDKAFP